jgi:Tfp pilus assembly protein PilF
VKNKEPGIRGQRPGTGSRGLGAGRRKLEIGDQEPAAGDQEPGTGRGPGVGLAKARVGQQAGVGQEPGAGDQTRQNAGARQTVGLVVLLVAVLAAYANHFQNEFHFDDLHSITGNTFIQELRNVPRFFVDPTLSSTMPDHAMYRPVVTTSLAVDYRLGHGFTPFWFHLSTFVWFALQLVLMFFLFRRIMDRTDPHPSNVWTALLATACYGLHPVNAETVNYIVQRADVYCTLGVVASLLWFAAYPAQRKWGWYLVPAVLAFLSKAPALIFPFLLLAYVWLFGKRRRLLSTLPSFVVTAAAAVLTSKITPASFQGGAMSDSLYRLTQPWVALRYFVAFFWPAQLSANNDWAYVSGPFSGAALAGYAFVAALLVMAFYASQRREARPIAFGIIWFVLALLPTSLMPLAEVANDHRMFFPFVGLALAVFWSLRLLLFRKTARLTTNGAWVRGAAAALIAVMAAEAAGTHQRNQVWRSEESLWRDVTIKSPKNGVGMMNYGITFMARGDYTTGLSYLQRAKELMPDYYSAELNLGIAYGGLGRDEEAEKEFKRAVALASNLAEPHFYYGRWLKSKGRLGEAQLELEAAIRANQVYFPARTLLIEVYTEQKNFATRDRLIADTLRQSNDGELARRFMEERATPEALLNLSAKYCNAGNYEDCLAAAKRAIELRPAYAEAYNNIAAAYIAMQKWDEGIQAAREALRINPGYEAAKSNLEWAQGHKR